MNLKEVLKNNWKPLIEIQVDPGIFKNNINIVQSLISKQTKIILAAKSSVYSLGTEMVRYSESLIDGIAVESLPPALEHACSGFEKDIYVLSPFLPQNSGLLPYLHECGNIIPCLDSVSTAELIADICRKNRYKIKVAVKLNLGLNRFGIFPSELENLVKILDNSPVETDSVYTHFSGTTDSDIGKLQQKENRFSDIVKPYRSRGIKVHVADSACIVRKIGTDLDIVRTGLLPIGVDPVEVRHDPVPGLKLCFKVLSTVLHITDVKKGAELGYRYFAPHDTKVATISGGYAHGLPRDACFNGGYALIRGTKCPYAGKSFMEYSIIDISDCDFPVNTGDRVEIFSNECHPFHLATLAGNIPEIFFTPLSKSIERNYIESENSLAS